MIKRRWILILMLVATVPSVWAQSNNTSGYYDSIVNAQMNRKSATTKVKTSTSSAKNSVSKSHATSPSNRSDNSKSEARLTRDSLIRDANKKEPVYLSDGVVCPAAMWYGNNFVTTRVRVKNLPLDSLPDEINLRLVRNENEFCFPTKGVKSSPYGWRWERAHRGVDIALTTGTPVYSVFPGVVRVVSVMGGYGNCVVVRHYNGLETLYGHLSKICVKPKQVVDAGTLLGLGGNTGRSTGPHLHFETRFLYQSFDPEWVIDIEKRALRTHTLHLDKSYFGVHAPKGRKPQEFKADKSFVKETTKRSRSGPTYYTTQYSDDWERLAKRYNTTVEQLRALNPDAPKRLSPGIKLVVRR